MGCFFLETSVLVNVDPHKQRPLDFGLIRTFLNNRDIFDHSLFWKSIAACGRPQLLDRCRLWMHRSIWMKRIEKRVDVGLDIGIEVAFNGDFVEHLVVWRECCRGCGFCRRRCCGPCRRHGRAMSAPSPKTMILELWACFI